ncbi:MAG: aspartate-semialdehyde dehydrogenase [Fimbriimonadaceae bacterium]|nr:aspartate-semialdehyde dehydrogenase [Fimbriimonadaceae bacterium]
MSRLNAAVVGATGIAGQQFLAALADHPLFEVTHLAASSRSAGKTYLEAITTAAGSTQWFCTEPLAPRFAQMTVIEAAKLDAHEVDVVFTALESDAAAELEPLYAQHVPVMSTASAFRMAEDVPVLVPGVNPQHAPLIRQMQAERGWQGFVVPNPNCTTVGLVVSLAPLQQAFGLDSVVMTSLQGCSGAGRSPGVIALDIVDNVIPYIPKEEEKVEAETRKILGTLSGGRITPADFRVSATCTRVPVLEAHTESVFVSLTRPATVEQVSAAMQEFGSEFTGLGHPSSPTRLITVTADPFRPQPRLDRVVEDGMTTTVGRIRACDVMGNGVKYLLVSHNTKMGAGKGALLMAEELVRLGYIGA